MAVQIYLKKDNKDIYHLENYPTDYNIRDGIEIENLVFDGSISMDGHYRGRSASGLIFFVKGHPSGYEFFAHMSITSVAILFSEYNISNGNTSGKFKFKKQGANVFIAPVMKDKDK